MRFYRGIALFSLMMSAANTAVAGSAIGMIGPGACLKSRLEKLVDENSVSQIQIPSKRQAFYNPTGEMDNCVACTSAFLKNASAKKMVYTAESLERDFAAAGLDQEFDLPHALEYMQKGTGLRASARPVAFMDPKAPFGFYAIFYGDPSAEVYHHVVAAWILPNGRRFVFDGQLGRTVELKSPGDWMALARKYKAGGGRPYLFVRDE